MNILVIGGGEPGKFGSDFVLRARSEGHNVRVLSHRKRRDTDCAVNFSSTEDVINKIKSSDSIDIMIYNTSVFGYPNEPQNYTAGTIVNEKLYLFNFRLHVTIPHAIATAAMNHMDGGKIMFITSDMVHDKERNKYLEHVGYCGGKAYQHQLMLALAEYNDKDITVSSISPFFNYNVKDEYKSVFNKVYDYVFDHGKEMNGKIFECFDA